MKAENIQSNTSAPFLAGRSFGTFHTETGLTIVNRLLKDAKNIHTKEDMKHYCDGYKETLKGTQGSKDSQTSYVRCILKVATGLDAKLCEYHKVKTPGAGQKVVQKHIDNGTAGLDSLAKALRIPSAGKAEGDGDGESEPAAKDAKSLSDLYATFVGDAMTHGHTKDDIAAFLAKVIAS